MSRRKVWYYGTEYGTVFWNSEGFIHYIHENDMDYREEYFKEILEYLDVEINFYDPESIYTGPDDEVDYLPKWVDDYVRKMES